jgi:hypothetical protein
MINLGDDLGDDVSWMVILGDGLGCIYKQTDNLQTIQARDDMKHQ